MLDIDQRLGRYHIVIDRPERVAYGRHQGRLFPATLRTTGVTA